MTGTDDFITYTLRPLTNLKFASTLTAHFMFINPNEDSPISIDTLGVKIIHNDRQILARGPFSIVLTVLYRLNGLLSCQ